MTDGILLAETQTDRTLSKYDTIIIDEAHERSLNIDFLLGYLKQLLPSRPDLKIIITSATIDPQRFSKHFDERPDHRGLRPHLPRRGPLPAAASRGRRPDPGHHATPSTNCSAKAPATSWCSSPASARSATPPTRSNRKTCAGTEILPLYARLSVGEQHRVFQRHTAAASCSPPTSPRRRSPCRASSTSSTPATPASAATATAPRSSACRSRPISQASADQRKGRCGRVSEGICIRLYAEDDFEARPEFTDPEILRTNLASVILQMKAIGLGDIAEFPFIDPPDYRNINDGIGRCTSSAPSTTPRNS